MKRLLLGSGAVIIIAPFLLYFGSYAYLARFENPGFAAQYFEPVVPIDQVLATRKWHRLGAEPWDCTYAIADLATSAPDVPETWGEADQWSPTPAEPLGETTRDALGFCGPRYWSEDVQARLAQAMEAQGSFYRRFHVGEQLWIYSRPQNIVAKIRYGD